jgi:hypothetical protein
VAPVGRCAEIGRGVGRGRNQVGRPCVVARDEGRDGMAAEHVHVTARREDALAVEDVAVL